MPRALSGGFDAVLREMEEGDRRGQGFAFSGNRPPARSPDGLADRRLAWNGSFSRFLRLRGGGEKLIFARFFFMPIKKGPGQPSAWLARASF